MIISDFHIRLLLFQNFSHILEVLQKLPVTSFFEHIHTRSYNVYVSYITYHM